jgi:hydrogenase/urease accessory protein HupE
MSSHENKLFELDITMNHNANKLFATCRSLGLLCVASLLWCHSSALAHWSDLSVAEITTQNNTVQVLLTYPTGLTAFADSDKNGWISGTEVNAYRVPLTKMFKDNITVTSAEQPGVLSIQALKAQHLPKQVSSQTHTSLRLTYLFPAPVKQYKLRYDLFVPGVSTASCVATIQQENEVQSVVFTPNHREFAVDNQIQTAPVNLIGFVQLGFEHILSGYDHLLFLLALLALGGGLKYLLKVVTAFTVAHSITIALTTLGFIRLPSQIIESGIALSIAVVALENLWRRFDATRLERGRWLVVFAFGLLHGMGFAGILKDLEVPSSNLPLAIFGFNAGVELGQLSVVIPVFVLLTGLKRVRWNLPAQYIASLTAVFLGGYWFVQRAFLGG